MKKTSILIVLCSLLLSIDTASAGEYMVDEMTMYTSGCGIWYTIKHEYNDRKQITQKYYEYRDFEDDWKVDTKYDSQGRVLEIKTSHVIDGKFYVKNVESNTYDSDDNLTSYYYDIWANDNLSKSNRSTYFYDDNNNLIREEKEYMIANNSPQEYLVEETNYYTYDENNMRISRLCEPGETLNNNPTRYTYTYDEYGNRLSEKMETKEDSWINKQLNIYTYDDAGNELSWTIQKWENNDWQNIQLNEYKYDQNNNKTEFIHYVWGAGPQKWVPAYKYTWAYDTNGDILEYLREKVDDNKEYYNSYRTTYTYNDRGMMLTGLQEEWENDMWTDDIRYNNTFDNNGNLVRHNCDMFLADQWYPYGNGNDFEMEDSFGNHFYYGGVQMDISWLPALSADDAATVQSTAKAFPNPFNANTTISYYNSKPLRASISLFDNEGNKVMERREFQTGGQQNIVINGSGLCPGVYHYIVRAGGKMHTGNIVLIK